MNRISWIDLRKPEHDHAGQHRHPAVSGRQRGGHGTRPRHRARPWPGTCGPRNRAWLAGKAARRDSVPCSPRRRDKDSDARPREALRPFLREPPCSPWRDSVSFGTVTPHRRHFRAAGFLDRPGQRLVSLVRATGRTATKAESRLDRNQVGQLPGTKLQERLGARSAPELCAPAAGSSIRSSGIDGSRPSSAASLRDRAGRPATTTAQSKTAEPRRPASRPKSGRRLVIDGSPDGRNRQPGSRESDRLGSVP